MLRHPYVSLILLIPLFAVLFNGCLEIETTSRVNSDGTIHRTVVIKGDSAAIHAGDFPLPLDATWEREIQKSDDKRFILTATRLFRDADEMSEALKGTTGKTLGLRAELQRQFQWFFTKLRYRETWLNFDPFQAVPVTDYLSPTEVDFFIRHELSKEPYPTEGDSLALKDASERFEKWHAANLFEAYYRAFMDGVKKLNDPRLTPASVAAAKDKLCEKSKQYLEKNKIDTLKLIFRGVLKTPTVQKAMAANPEGFEDYMARLRFLDGIMENSYHSNIIMPGLIVQTNASALDGSKASWEDYIKFCLLRDTDLIVESRITNWWAIVVTGIIVAALLILLVATTLRRRRVLQTPAS